MGYNAETVSSSGASVWCTADEGSVCLFSSLQQYWQDMSLIQKLRPRGRQDRDTSVSELKERKRKRGGGWSVFGRGCVRAFGRSPFGMMLTAILTIPHLYSSRVVYIDDGTSRHTATRSIRNPPPASSSANRPRQERVRSRHGLEYKGRYLRLSLSGLSVGRVSSNG